LKKLWPYFNMTDPNQPSAPHDQPTLTAPTHPKSPAHRSPNGQAPQNGHANHHDTTAMVTAQHLQQQAAQGQQTYVKPDALAQQPAAQPQLQVPNPLAADTRGQIAQPQQQLLQPAGVAGSPQQHASMSNILRNHQQQPVANQAAVQRQAAALQQARLMQQQQQATLLRNARMQQALTQGRMSQFQNCGPVPQWAQCTLCKKWRTVLTNDIYTFTVPENFTCANSTNPKFNNCQAGQEIPNQTDYTAIQLQALSYQRKIKYMRQMQMRREQMARQGLAGQQSAIRQNIAAATSQSTLAEQQQKLMEAYKQQEKARADQARRMAMMRQQRERQAREQDRQRIQQQRELRRKRKRAKDGDESWAPSGYKPQQSTDSSESESEGSSEEFLPSRSSMQRRTRKKKSDQANIEEENWTQQETQALLVYVTTRGVDNFDYIHTDAVLKDKTPEECKARFQRIYSYAEKKNKQMASGNYVRRKKKKKKRKRQIESEVMPQRKSARLLGTPKRQYTFHEEIDVMLDQEEKQKQDAAQAEDLYPEKIERILAHRTVKKRITKDGEEAAEPEKKEGEEEKKDEESTEKKSDDDVQELEITEYLIKIVGLSHLHVEWIAEVNLDERFGAHRVKPKLRRYHQKAEVIKAENIRKFGEGHNFDPDFLVVDRIIDRMSESVKNEAGIVVATTEKVLVKWLGASYIDATWESVKAVPGEKIAQFRRFDIAPTDLQPRNLHNFNPRFYTDVNRRTYKNGNKLRDYQELGLNWLISKFFEGKNCILADEMGLGKTVQSVAYLEHLYRYNNIRGPFLVVAPLSTIQHWKREFEAWTDMNVVVYHSSENGEKSREMIRNKEWFFKNNTTANRGLTRFNVLLTSYELVLHDIEHLSILKWAQCIVDEGHRLKSMDSKLAEAFRTIRIDRRILLTGTPIQNTTQELFNLLHFLEPNQFRSWVEFQHRFCDASTEEASSDRLKELTDYISPYVLRRLKTTVEKSIPKMQETIIDIELTTVQKTYYRAIFEKNRQFLIKGCSKANMPKLINIEIQLRKCCNHPWLIEGAVEKEVPDDASDEEYFKRTVEASGKMVLLDKLLPKLKKEGHKVLIFTQMKGVLDILESYLSHKQIGYERLDGTSKAADRNSSIDRFCDPKRNRLVFILTTRAGGVGLNLTAADTVIIYDSDWNPQLDKQAQSRCHRIGQDRPVQVYRLVTRKTYEAEMFERASKKLGLDAAILGSMTTTNDKSSAEATKDLKKGGILDNMLRHGAYSVLCNEDDKDAKKFEQADIEDILKHSARTVDATEDVVKLGSIGLHSVSRKAFASGQADTEMNMDDPDFWQKVLTLRKEEEEDLASVLLTQLTDGSATVSQKARDEFWKKFEAHLNSCIELKKSGKPVPSIDILRGCATQFENVWPNRKQRTQCSQLMKTVERRVRRKVQTSTTTKQIDQIISAAERHDTYEANQKANQKSSQKTKKRKRRQRAPATNMKLFLDSDWPQDEKLLTHLDVCAVCKQTGSLLLCDGPCVHAYHETCVPEGDETGKRDHETKKWLCADCTALYQTRKGLHESSGGKTKRFHSGTYRVRVYLNDERSMEAKKVKLFAQK